MKNNCIKKMFVVIYEVWCCLVLFDMFLWFIECPMKRNSDGKLYGDVEAFKKSANFRSIVVFVNNFAYYLDENIIHYLIFSLEALSDEKIEHVIDKQIKPKESLYIDSVYWQNPQNLKSIPDFWHAHVLVKVDDVKM